MNRFISKYKKKIKIVNNSNGNGIKNYRSRKFYELKKEVNIVQEDLNNKKLDQVRKLVSFTKCFNKVSFQNENIKAWHHNKEYHFSSKVQQGILGKFYAKIKVLSKDNNFKDKHDNYKYNMLGKFERTTKTCVCGEVNQNITLNDREYFCPSCDYTNHRDIHSSYIINNFNNTGCGIQSGGHSVNNTINTIASIRDEMKSSVTVELAVSVLLDKIKSKNCKALTYNLTPRSLVL